MVHEVSESRDLSTNVLCATVKTGKKTSRISDAFKDATSCSSVVDCIMSGSSSKLQKMLKRERKRVVLITLKPSLQFR